MSEVERDNTKTIRLRASEEKKNGFSFSPSEKALYCTGVVITKIFITMPIGFLRLKVSNRTDGVLFGRLPSLNFEVFHVHLTRRKSVCSMALRSTGDDAIHVSFY